MSEEFAVTTEGLTKHFGKVRAVDGIDLRVPKGSVYGLIGPNGAGKTTTYSLLCGWTRPTAGRATVLGVAPGDIASLKGRVSALPQDAALPPNTSLIQSLTYYARLQGMNRVDAKKAASGSLELVGLSKWGKVRAITLSHGMTKRIGLAQAFLGSPQLVLLDEPTAGLDPKSAHHIRDLIAELRKTATVVISSHNLFELEALCDYAAVIDHGKIVAQGPMSELTAKDTEVVIDLVAGSHKFELLEEKVGALGPVSAAAIDAGRKQMTIRFTTGEQQPADVITMVLKVLIDEDVLISDITRGQGLERMVLEIT